MKLSDKQIEVIHDCLNSIGNDKTLELEYMNREYCHKCEKRDSCEIFEHRNKNLKFMKSGNRSVEEFVKSTKRLKELEGLCKFYDDDILGNNTVKIDRNDVIRYIAKFVLSENGEGLSHLDFNKLFGLYDRKGKHLAIDHKSRGKQTAVRATLQVLDKCLDEEEFERTRKCDATAMLVSDIYEEFISDEDEPICSCSACKSRQEEKETSIDDVSKIITDATKDFGGKTH